MSASKKRSQITKVYEQFSHTSTDIKILINNAGLLDTDLSKIMKNVAESKDTCNKFKKVLSGQLLACAN